MKIIEENVNVINFTDLKTGDVFRRSVTQEVFMRLSSTQSFETTCDECDNDCECFFEDCAVNLETGIIESFSMFEKVEKWNATLTLSR